MTGNIVARRYAKALFAVAEGKGADELSAYGKELSEVAKSVEESPDVMKLFKSPLFSVEEKRKVLGQVSDRLSLGQVIDNFLNLLADKDRLAVLPEVSESFTTLLDQAEGVLRGELITAVDLAEDKKKVILEQLEKQAGKKLVLSFATDKDILGGVMLKVGDKVLDASLRAQLDILKETIKRGE